MRRRLLIALLALGTLVGFGSGFMRLAHHRGCAYGAWQPPAARAQ